jgi:4-hydroxythreonine-4-phosphate dehydrogenase
MSVSPPRLPLVITMGEPAGIGGDITIKAWLRRSEGLAPFFVIDDPERLRTLGDRIAPGRLSIATIDALESAATVFPEALPVLPTSLPAKVTPGKPDPANAEAVIAAIDRAVAFALAGRVAAVVTNPIHKKCLYDAGFRHPGHTEYLGALAGGARPVMMLLCPGLRVVPVTVHLALRDVVAALTTEKIVYHGEVAASALERDFGIDSPRLAVAGLNPHAGEGGALGREEVDIVAPAVEALRSTGIDVFGPVPADALFRERARDKYDAAICMYHDQALIPLKTIDFDGGVNVTLGLPFVRTSPDHGAALDIAATGTAREDSLLAALRTATDMARRRERHG